jgi:hypothetical protein
MWTDGQGFFYSGDCREGHREATPQEVATWELSKLPSPQEQIDALERQQLMLRATREFMLTFMELNAPPEVLAVNPGYQAVKAFDNQIKTLRDKL